MKGAGRCRTERRCWFRRRVGLQRRKLGSFATIFFPGAPFAGRRVGRSDGGLAGSSARPNDGTAGCDGTGQRSRLGCCAVRRGRPFQCTDNCLSNYCSMYLYGENKQGQSNAIAS